MLQLAFAPVPQHWTRSGLASVPAPTLFKPENIAKMKTNETDNPQAMERRWEGGDDMPEENTVNSLYFTADPGVQKHCGEEMARCCRNLRVSYQGAKPDMPGFEWDGHSLLCVGTQACRDSNWKLSNYIFSQDMYGDDFSAIT